MTLRPYEQSDKEACLELFRSNTPKFFAPHEETGFGSYLENPGHYFVLENPTIIGCGGYGVSDITAYLAWGMVHHTQHGTGAGKRLLLERLNLITTHPEVKDIILDTSQHTFGFFEKLGFVTTKITEHSYSENLHRYDMKLSLDEGSRQNLTALLLRVRAEGFANGVVNNQEKDD